MCKMATPHMMQVMHKSSGSLLYLADEPVDRSALPKSVGLVRFFSPKEMQKKTPPSNFKHVNSCP